MILNSSSFEVKSNSHVNIATLVLKCVKGIFNTGKEIVN